MNQPVTRSVVDLQEELARLSQCHILLILTDNRRSMISARRRNGVVEVRLQRIFLQASSKVVTELANLLAGRDNDRLAIRQFIDESFLDRSAGETAFRPPSVKRTASSHHDIAKYAEHLNATYLGGRSRAKVIWGKRNRARSRRSIRFGCYDPSRNVIIMNRKLDRPDIPAYFVEYILFHEMLHDVLGVGERADGRRDIHGSLFKLMERTYPDFDKAMRYEKELCKRLGSL